LSEFQPQPSDLARRLLDHTLRSLVADGPDVVRLDSGDPDFPTPGAVVEAMSSALHSGYTHYGHPYGDLDLRDVIAAQVSEAAEIEYRPAEIVVTHGATAALASSVLGFVKPGDRVLLPEPTYSLYSDLVRMAGGEVLYVPCGPPAFVLDLERIASAARSAKVLMICSPCNPTGAVYTEGEIASLADIARRHGLLVIADETYDHIVYDGAAFHSLLRAQLKDQLVCVQSFSKRYAMTGWRIGYVSAPQTIANVVGSVHRSFAGPLNSAVQRAAIAALNWQDRADTMLTRHHAARDMVVKVLSNGTHRVRPPAATFYALVRCPTGVESGQMVEIARRHGVLVRPGTEYGPTGAGFVRLSFACGLQSLAEGLNRLVRAFQSVERHDSRANQAN
jgi:aspartate aminotransferase